MPKRIQRPVSKVKPMSPTAGLKRTASKASGKKTRTYGKGGKIK